LEEDKLAAAGRFDASFYYTAEKNKPAHPYYPGGPVLHQTHGSGWPVGVVVVELTTGEGLVDPEDPDALRLLAVAVVDEDDDDEFMGEALVWDDGEGLDWVSM
jgi:hypothetical protein